MPLALWNDRYLTGDAEVDRQHRELFRLVNELHDTMMSGGSVTPAVERLVAYTEEHFATEERLMRAVRYPRTEAHKAQHDDLTMQARELLGAARGGQPVNTGLTRLIVGWIETHINAEDKALIAWVRINAAALRA